MKAQLPFLGLLTLLLSACLCQQLTPAVAHTKHTRALQKLFAPHAELIYARTVSHWKHKDSSYYLRTCDADERSLHYWCIEVQHPDGTSYRHHCPHPPFSKAARRPTSNKLRISHHHCGERIILTLHHLGNAKVALHAHNLGYMPNTNQTDAAATATLSQAVQSGGAIRLFNEGHEHRLTEWEQECLRRILKGACATSPLPPSRRTLRFYSPSGTLLCERPLSEYWPQNTWSNSPGIATLPGTILPGDTRHRYLYDWWHIVSCRLKIYTPIEPHTGNSPQSGRTSITKGFITEGLRSGPGTISGQALDELQKLH